MVKYHRLFSISNLQEATVQDMWIPNASVKLFVCENNLLIKLMGDLDGFRGNLDEDICRWKLEEDESFSVKSLYLKLVR
jgi:hypothetical protein